MKTIPQLRRFLVSLLVFSICMLGWQPAAEASIDDFIKVYKEIESNVPANTLPVSSQDVIAYKSLFTCVEGGGDVVVCTDQFHNTNAGKNASDQLDIPEAVWQVVDAYIAWKAGDTWGVIEHLGIAAVCAILQVLTGGSTDICGLIQDLYDAAKDVLDAGKAVAEFFKSVGEGAWSAIKSVGCSLGLGGCDESPPPPPPEVSAYKQYFAPKVKDMSALKARESSNQNAFGTLVLSTSTAAKSKYPDDAVKKAAAAFTKAVYKQWSADMTGAVLSGPVLQHLASKRHTYGEVQQEQHVAAAASAAAAAYLSSKAKLEDKAIAYCASDFSEFQHFDYWVADPQFQSLWQQLGSAPTTANWCLKFWYQNQDTFGKYFHNAVAAFCPTSGTQLVCSNLKNYENCLGIMGSVGEGAQCVANVKAIGMDVAKEIMAYFKSKGSKYPCEVANARSLPGSQAPVTLTCHRPTQQYHCDKYYHDHYGSGANKLPVKVLTCALGTEQPAGYQTKVDGLWNQTIPALQAKYPSLAGLPKGPDPLVLGVNKQLYAALEADAKQYGLDKQIVMSWEPSIDGVEQPTLESNIGGDLNKMTKNTMPALGSVNPPDPKSKLTINKLAINQTAAGSGKANASPTAAGFGQAKGGAAGTKAGGSMAMTASPSVAAGAALGSAGGPMKTMSGDMPPGFGGPMRKGNAPMKATTAIVLPKPSLAVVSVRAQVQQNCRQPQPALIAVVTIRNTGGPLAANKGSVYVKEFGGGNLGSGGIQLPALGNGQTTTVNIPAITMQPYASLAGMHQLQAILNPQQAGGEYSFNKPNPYLFSVVFPAGYCSPATRPGGRIPQPGAIRPSTPQLNPQPEPPSSPRLRLPAR